MSVAFTTTLQQMARILMFMLAGFALNRLHILPKGSGAGISKLATSLFLPARLIYNNMTEFNLAKVGEYGQLILLGGFYWLIVTVLVLPAAKKMSVNGEENGVYLYGLSFPNTSGVGTPLVLALLGTSGLFQFNLFMLIGMIMTYVWGVGLFMDSGHAKESGRARQLVKKVFNPLCLFMLAGFILGSIGAKNWIPGTVMEFIGEMGSFFVPVSLIVAGYTIADYPLKEMFNRPKSYLFALIRLIVIPAAALALAWVLKLPLFTVTLVVLAYACPSGMNVVVFPASYGRDCKTGASVVLLSNLGSVITVPLLYALSQVIFG